MPAKAISFVKKWIDTDDWLLMSGVAGTGKTGLSICAYKAMVDKGIHSTFARTPLLLQQEKETFDPKSPSVVGPLSNVEFLVLDDIGAERGTEWAVTTLRDLLITRYDRKLRTVITTNLTSEEFAKCYGERLADRLGEVAVLMVMTNKSLRQAMRKVIV